MALKVRGACEVKPMSGGGQLEEGHSPSALGLWMRTLQEGWRRIRLQMKGRSMSRAVGGAVRASRDRRLANAATR